MSPATPSLLQRARQRLAREVLRLLAPPLDASPAEGGLGPSPFRADTPGPLHARLPSPSLDPTLLAAALLAPHDPVAARERLEIWLHTDTPGLGQRWIDVPELACRLIHMAALHTRTDLPDPLARQLAGAARAHAAAIFAGLPTRTGDPDVALCHAALVIAGLSWPSLDGARSWRGAGLGGLRQSLADAAGEDGPGTAAPAHLARAAWAVALARAWADASGARLPADADAAWQQVVEALWRIGGDDGYLPDSGAAPLPLLPLGAAPLPHTLRNLAAGWGLSTPTSACPLADDDAAALLLPADTALSPAEPMADEEWRMWAWRSSGVVVTHRRIRRDAARFWCSTPQQALALSLAGESLLHSPLRAGTVSTARVDGAQATILLQHADGTTDIRLRQARLSMTTEGTADTRWTLPEGWEVSTTDSGFELRAPSRPLLVIKTDPVWQWHITDGTLQGHGEPQRVRYSFELR